MLLRSEGPAVHFDYFDSKLGH